MNLEKYTRLKEKIDKLRRDADKSIGALEQIKERLQREHQCDSVKGAIRLLKKKRAELAKLKKEFAKRFPVFEREHNDVLS